MKNRVVYFGLSNAKVVKTIDKIGGKSVKVLVVAQMS